MNDPAPPRWTDPVELPAPTIYDPAEDSQPPFSGAAEGSVVLLLVGTADPAWAARAAVELSDAWTEGGRRVVLADFHLDAPALDSELGGQGFEGVVDLFMYGASVARCARDVPDRAFQFIPTGTYTPDLQAVFRHPRWRKLVDGFKRSGSLLVLFVPADAADLGALATWVDSVILLGAHPEREPLEPLHRAGAEIRGLVVPPAGESFVPHPLPDLPPTPRHPDPQRAAADGEDLHLPPPPRRIPHRGHRAAVMLLWALLGLAVLIAIGYAAYALASGTGSRTSSADTLAVEMTPVAASAGGSPLGQPLPYSVRVVAFGGFDAARERVRELSATMPGVLFYVTPESVQGITYYKVMAGTVSTEERARQLRDRLLAAGIIDGADAVGESSLIEELPFGLVLGERPFRAAARAAVDSLLDRNVPAYHLAVPHSDGSLHWYLYAGAFADTAGARRLSDHFAGIGLDPRVTFRFGAPASPEL